MSWCATWSALENMSHILMFHTTEGWSRFSNNQQVCCVIRQHCRLVTVASVPYTKPISLVSMHRHARSSVCAPRFDNQYTKLGTRLIGFVTADQTSDPKISPVRDMQGTDVESVAPPCAISGIALGCWQGAADPMRKRFKWCAVALPCLHSGASSLPLIAAPAAHTSAVGAAPCSWPVINSCAWWCPVPMALLAAPGGGHLCCSAVPSQYGALADRNQVLLGSLLGVPFKLHTHDDCRQHHQPAAQPNVKVQWLDLPVGHMHGWLVNMALLL